MSVAKVLPLHRKVKKKKMLLLRATHISAWWDVCSKGTSSSQVRGKMGVRRGRILRERDGSPWVAARAWARVCRTTKGWKGRGGAGLRVVAAHICRHNKFPLGTNLWPQQQRKIHTRETTREGQKNSKGRVETKTA